MSRIGKKSIPVPGGVKVAVNAASRTVSIEGPKGKTSFVHRPEVKVSFSEADKAITCTVDDPAKIDLGNRRAYWGTTRATLNNMVAGVTKGYERKLEIVGVGWDAKVAGKKITLKLGYADPIFRVIFLPATRA
jgi:large subunit ribosomal protein L6